MGIDMELEFDKYCKVGGSPKTVLPSHRHCSKIEKRNTKGKPTFRNDRLSLKEDFTEITFRRYRSASCKTTPSRTSGLEANEVLKRGSVYQSSDELSKMYKIGAVEERRKIEYSRSSAATLSSGIVDSLCSSDEDRFLEEQKTSSAMSLFSDSNTTSVISSDGFLEIPLSLNNTKNLSAENVERESIKDPKLRCDRVIGPLSDGNVIRERDTALVLNKSLSAKLALPYSPSRSESDCSRASSPKSRFSPIRKMFDPFTKSKSLRSPLGSSNEPCELPRNKTLRKSLLHDFSNTSKTSEFGPQVKKDSHASAVPCSPAHLRGHLKLENKHGVPFFEFSLKYPEDVFVAKTWKAENSLNWVYTFHSVHSKRKSNASGWGLKDSSKESSLVGQMQVSCYLCTELKDAGAFDNSMVTEFVVYDIVNARKNIASQDNSSSSPDVVKTSNGSDASSVEVSDQSKPKVPPKQPLARTRFDLLSPHPWAPTDLHPSHEIAAILIQVPFEKRESLKYKRGDVKNGQMNVDLHDVSIIEHKKQGVPDCLSPVQVNAVTPCGNHSLPSTESRGPSPLLDRWRLGGGCDCGGWDMACPLFVFDNTNGRGTDDRDLPLMENQKALELFLQGAKENTPALTISLIEEGLYAVDFHAQLSTLQAFSICVAILHSTEASIAVGRDRDKQMLQCDSLRVFIEEEVKHLMEAVTVEEKSKFGQKMEELEETHTSFVLNPPFSPIARV